MAEKKELVITITTKSRTIIITVKKLNLIILMVLSVFAALDVAVCNHGMKLSGLNCILIFFYIVIFAVSAASYGKIQDRERGITGQTGWRRVR